MPAKDSTNTGGPMYFSYTPNDGFVTHELAQEAKEAAEAELCWFRREALSSGEWHEEAEAICWGRIMAEVVDYTPEFHTADFRLMMKGNDDAT